MILPVRRHSLLLLALLGPALLVRADARSAVERLRADVTRLAGDDWQGRRAGTEGADRAADWIAAELRRIGLEPGGADGSYFQRFTFIDGVVLGPENALSAGPSGRAFRPGEDFRPLGFSAAGEAAGEVVFAGYGIAAKDLAYDDYEGIDVKDRIVLVLRYGPGGNDPHSKWAAFTPLRMKAAVARDKGAKALLVVTGPLTPDAADELVGLRADASLADAGLPAVSLKRVVAETLFESSQTSLEAEQKRLDESGRPAPRVLSGARAQVKVDVTPKRSTTQNVVGRLRPASGGGSQESVVIGAHYDHLGLGASGSLDSAPEGKIHHGADDNASGVAGLVELARRFGARRADLRRSLVFVAFGGEELGTLGSSHFVKDPPSQLGSVVAMINMDMIGRLREDALDVYGLGTSPAWRPLIERANRDAALKLKLHDGGYGPSDHAPFYAAGKPVLFVFTGNHGDYHRPSDTADRINAAGIAKVLELVEPVARSLAASRDPVQFVRVAAEKEQSPSGTRGFRVWVGSIPDYSEEGIGVRLTGVSAGSPAEKAGVQAGDVIVRFGPKEIRSIYDYTYALGEYKPGDTVAVVVRRDGQERTLELTLAARPSATR